MALNHGLNCAAVPLRTYSLTHSCSSSDFSILETSVFEFHF